jgi:hypothetical protein
MEPHMSRLKEKKGEGAQLVKKLFARIVLYDI